jgi:sugar O-acyltransferase (sialic acid O-acetyltransferase NeuD family)
MKKIIILGGKGTPVVIAEQILNAINKFNVKLELLGFAFDDETFGKEINGIPVLEKTYNVYSKYKTYDDVYYIFSLYRSDLIQERIRLRDSFQIPMEKYITFVHPLATVSQSATMGFGNIILANVVVNPNVKIGNFNTFNSNSLVGHDTTMGDSNFIAGHTVIGSNLKIGSGNFFGLNCSVKNFVEMGNYNLIGMASNVIRNLSDYQIVVGNPAKEISKNNIQ